MNESYHNQLPYLKSMSNCLNKVVQDGFSEGFELNDRGIRSLHSGKIYPAEEISMIGYFRFEGNADPSENALMYIIETTDGTKGTLIDASGTMPNPKVNTFFSKVNDLRNKFKS